MARWAARWLVAISLLTFASYSATNALRVHDETSMAMQALALPTCRQATQALVAAGDGNAPNASATQRNDWDVAAQTVLRACPST